MKSSISESESQGEFEVGALPATQKAELRVRLGAYDAARAVRRAAAGPGRAESESDHDDWG